MILEKLECCHRSSKKCNRFACVRKRKLPSPKTATCTAMEAEPSAPATPNTSGVDNGDDGESSSSPPLSKSELDRIRRIFPLPLPLEVMRRIEHLSYMNCIRKYKEAVHREMMDTEIYLEIVDMRNWNGQDYLGARRMPGLIDGDASDSDFWDSDLESDDGGGILEAALDAEGAIGAALGGGGDGGDDIDIHAQMLQGLQNMLLNRLGLNENGAPLPHRNQRQDEGAS